MAVSHGNHWRAFALGLTGVLLAGCPGLTPFQAQIDPSCLEAGWIAEAAQAISVETDTFEAVLTELVREVPLVAGDWMDDFGDARFYGPAVLLELGRTLDSPCLQAFGRESLEGNRDFIRTARARPVFFWNPLSELSMAAYGMIETYHFQRRTEDRALIDWVLDRANFAFELTDRDPGELADPLLSIYGPTTQVAGLAALNLRYALRVGGPRGPERGDYGLRLIDTIDQRAFDSDRGVYRFSSESTGLYLYPNATMIVANSLANQLTNEPRYLGRAEATFDNIQLLKDPDRGNYRSPYSAELMGATTDDYSTLSSQLYLITALNLLYESTGDERYDREARDVLRFVCTCLRDHGRLVHHWIDGRKARPGDFEYYCSGCNLQALHVMWYMTRLGTADGS